MASDISRQAFLRGGLGAVAGVLLGSCGETAGQPSSPGSPDWGALGGSIQGQVILPSSADYAGAKGLFNSRFDNSTPAASSQCNPLATCSKLWLLLRTTASKLPRVAVGIPTSVPPRQMV